MLRASAYRPVLICALSYGSAVAFARMSFEDGSNALTVVTVRCLFSMVAIGIAMRLMGAVPALPRERRLMLALGVVFALNVYAFYKSVELLRVPLAILCFYVYPLLSGLFSALAGLERISARTAGFALVSFAGLALATGASPEAVNLHGVGLALLSAVMIAVLLVVSTRYVAHVEAKTRTFWMMASTSLTLAGATIATDAAAWPVRAHGWAALAAVCVLYAIGVVALFTSASRIGATRTAMMMNLEPVVAISASWLLLGQGLTLLQLLGGGLVIAGVLGSQLLQGPGAPRPPAANPATG